MNKIADILPITHIFIDIDVGSKKRVFEQVGLLFENTQHIARNIVFDSLFAREKLGSTGLGHGVAIPHGRIKGLRQPIGAFVKMQHPIPFDAPDGQPVSLIFVLLVPEHANETHLELLSELAQIFSNKSLREQLVAAPSAAIIHHLITAWRQHGTN